MRFVWGPIPASKSFNPADVRWKQLQSPRVEQVVLQFAVGMIPCFIAAGLSIQRAAEGLPPIVFLIFLLAPAILIPLHELSHIFGYLTDPRSPDLLTGIWVSHGIWYVVYDQPLPRKRVLIMLVAPFFALSIPLIVAAMIIGGPWGWGLAYLSMMHTSLCIGDFASFVRVSRQVPRSGFVQNNGWNTYWSTFETQSEAPAELN